MLSTTGCERGKKILGQNMGTLKKAEWINNMETELGMLKEGHQVNMHLNELKATLNKIANWKTPSLEGIHGFWF